MPVNINWSRNEDQVSKELFIRILFIIYMKLNTKCSDFAVYKIIKTSNRVLLTHKFNFSCSVFIIDLLLLLISLLVLPRLAWLGIPVIRYMNFIRNGLVSFILFTISFQKSTFIKLHRSFLNMSVCIGEIYKTSRKMTTKSLKTLRSILPN